MKISAVFLATVAVMCTGKYTEVGAKTTYAMGDKGFGRAKRQISLEEHPRSPESDATDENRDSIGGRANIELPIKAFLRAYGTKIRQAKKSSFGFDVAAINPTRWSSWSCCRRIVNLQSRERMLQAPRIQVEYRQCTSNYCLEHECKDRVKVCSFFGTRTCDKSNVMSTYMSHHCPTLCKYCVSPTAIPTTTAPFSFPTGEPSQETTRPPWWVVTTRATQGETTGTSRPSWQQTTAGRNATESATTTRPPFV